MTKSVDRKDESKKFSRRSFFFLFLQGFVYSILGINFYRIQIESGDKYHVLADKNRIRLYILPPPRGIITDRNNNILVTNIFSYDVLLDRDMLEHAEKVLTALQHICSKSTLVIHDIKTLLERRDEAKKKNTSLVLCRNIQWRDIARIEANLEINSIVRISQEYKRYYIYGSMLSHITGYVGMPSKKELAESSLPNYKDFMIGKNGIEAYCEEDLRGIPGVKKVEVNAFNRVVREISYKQSIQGSSLELSLDLHLQQKIIDITSEHKGIYIVLDVQNGEVIAMHAPPGYDPNFFTANIKSSEWQNLVNHPEKPLVNKNISALYPPGSTFKMIMMLAILKKGLGNENVFCTGEYRFGNRVFHCWKKHGHGNVNITNALQNSCNIYFAVQGTKVGIRDIAAVARNIGIGAKTGIELPFEVSGLMPDKEWKKKRYNKPWTIGDTVNVTIGQGYTLTTPIQLVVMAARLATGKMIIPTLLRKNSYHDLDFERLTEIFPGDLKRVQQSMYEVMGRRHGDGLEIAGKTGTVQIISNRKATGKFKDHGVFVGFAPYHTPKYAVVSIVENSGWGVSTALPITQKIFYAAFERL